jgi:Eco29kI restriction endonuclease
MAARELTAIDSRPFDPLSVENVGVTLAVELNSRPLVPLPLSQGFPGAGVYALYYTGRHPAYKAFTALDKGKCRYPVYIGKAAGENAKQGFRTTMTSEKKLFGRIGQHVNSIEQAHDLSISEFRCRYLVLNDAYISLAESVMIRLFRPPWNGMSLGSNQVGGPRMAGKESLWDSLHPGRRGRPRGSMARAKEASQIISARAAALGEKFDDPVLNRMYRRVMKSI